MAKVTIHITLKPTLLDAQGRTVQSALHSLGFDTVQNLRIGKIIELELPNDTPEAIRTQVIGMCDKLLANPVTESYHMEIQTEENE
jgi:phosphoribosylformylglycinamidine synthase